MINSTINQQHNNLNPSNPIDLLSSIDAALQDEVPEDIMSRHLADDIVYYIAPILSMVAFLLIMIFGVIPSTSTMMEKIGQVSDLRTQSNDLNTRISKLDELQTNITGITSTLNKINTLVPEGKTEVVKFSQRISQAAQTVQSDGKLTTMVINEIKAGESTLTTTGVIIPGLSVSQVPVQFTFTSNRNDFESFFNNLYNGPDFFVVDEMQLSLNSKTNLWSGEVSLVKYQFDVSSSFNPQTAYGVISENQQPNATVVNFLNSNFTGN